MIVPSSGMPVVFRTQDFLLDRDAVLTLAERSDKSLALTRPCDRRSHIHLTPLQMCPVTWAKRGMTAADVGACQSCEGTQRPVQPKYSSRYVVTPRPWNALKSNPSRADVRQGHRGT